MTAGPLARNHFIDIAGSRMHVVDVGEGPPVMLGHSFLWDAEMWRPQIDFLARRHRVIVPDLWGHGTSGPLPSHSCGIRDLAHQHLALLDALEIERCAVVGLSVGGMWGAELALIAPERVSALVLMGTSLAAEPADTQALYYAMLGAIAKAGVLPDQVREAAVPLFFSPGARERRPNLIEAFDASLRGWNAERLMDSIVPLGRMIFGRRDAAAELADIDAPTLVMTGSGDLARPPHEGRAMAELLDCPFIEIPQAGHISSLEAPDFVNDALSKFLARNQ